MLKFINVGADLAALGLLVGVAAKVIPALAGLLAIIYYGIVVYDRIRYGPELEKRMFWHQRYKKDNHHHEKPTNHP